MKKIITLLFIALFNATSWGQIQLLRYNDNFEYLKNDTVEKTGFEKLKHIPITRKTNVSFGGEIREQYQYYNNPNFGDRPPGYQEVKNGQVWHRIMLHTNLEFGTRARIFIQGNSTFRFLNPNPLTPEIDENQLSLHQAFLDFRMGNKWSTRVGRQEVCYGNHRLITFREGPNTRLAFDALVFKRVQGKERLDLFVMTPVISNPGISDDESFKDLVVGMYDTKEIIEDRLMIDFYSLSLNSKRKQYNYEGGNESRQTFGFRLFSNNLKVNYELEANYQYGKFNQLRINAYGITADVHVSAIEKCGLTVGLASNYFTGDKNPQDNKLNSYNPLFSKPQYGLTAPIGASNIINVNPYIKTKLTEKLKIYAGAYFMWRESDLDGTYTPLGYQLRPGPGMTLKTNHKEIGSQLTLEATYVWNNNLSFGLDAGYFVAGKYVRETGEGKDITYLSLKGNFKF
jgi:hypothetical protein